MDGASAGPGMEHYPCQSDRNHIRPRDAASKRGTNSMPKCENCGIRDAQARLEGFVNGKRESHLFCKQCAEQIMQGALSAEGPFAGNGNALGNIFAGRGGNGQSSAGTTTAERQGSQ